MLSEIRHIAFFLLILCSSQVIRAQLSSDNCGQHTHSNRLANYVMDVDFTPRSHTVRGTQVIQWVNNSPHPVDEVMMYMYLNAFSNTESSYLKNSSRWDPYMADRPAEDWGHVKLLEISDKRERKTLAKKWVADIDGNENDKTSLRLQLNQEVLPGDTLTLQTEFESKLPRLFVRSGFAEGGFCHFVHWYPKLGVYEEDTSGNWGWNCHQFLPGMEFYGEFGTYDVTIRAPANYVIGASGCRVGWEVKNEKRTHQFIANDVIDFAWVAYDDFTVTHDRWEHVEIELLSPPSHHRLRKRLIGAVKNSLSYMTAHVGPFPYDKITVMDPPVHAMRSGFMEYPTYITGGSYFAFPPQITSMESLIVHEFCHQYFMAIVATNEKEAPWLDEGFVTFFEDQIMEKYYGGPQRSLLDAFGITMGNSALTRSEYVGMTDPKIDAVATPGWEIKGPYKSTIYSKTATVLRTIKNWIGDDVFFDVIRCYYSTYKFSHPRADDFLNILFAYAQGTFTTQEYSHFKRFVKEAIYQKTACDFAVNSITSTYDETSKQYNSTITLEQLEEMDIPVDIRVNLRNGEALYDRWIGDTKTYTISLKTQSEVASVTIDPEHLVPLDLNWINNSKSTKKSHLIGVKYANRGLYWAQNLIQSLSFLF